MRMLIEEITEIGRNAVEITIAPEDEFRASPGQFVLLSRPDKDINGYYTISSPRVGETFDITVKVDPEEGELGPWLHSRDIGDTIEVDGPYGDVSYTGGSDVILFAGGPGIGPAIGIAERAMEEGYDADVHYFDEEPMHTARLQSLENQGADVIISKTTDVPENKIPVLDDSSRVFVFGFAGFVEAIRTTLGNEGYDTDRLEIESFGPE